MQPFKSPILWLSLIALLLTAPAMAGLSIKQFDLWGLQVGQLKDYPVRDRFLKTVQSQLNLSEDDALLSSAEYCLPTPYNYLLSITHSETEGFWLRASRSAEALDTCRGEKNESGIPVHFVKTGAHLPMLSTQFKQIQLDKTSLTEIQHLFGRPLYKTPVKLMYVLNRDRKGEKSCGYQPQKGEFAGTTITFDFNSQKLLEQITLYDGGGEC